MVTGERIPDLSLTEYIKKKGLVIVVEFMFKKVGLFIFLLIIVSPYSAVPMIPVSDEVFDDINAGVGLSLLLTNIHTSLEFNPLALKDTDGSVML